MAFSVGFFLLYFSLFSLLLGLWWSRKQRQEQPLTHFPKISILIAARNEEAHILTCLQAIANLRYPKEQLEVLVGNDRSTDRTQELVEAFQQEHAYVVCVPVTQDLPGIRGKANVLAQLGRLATSDYFFYTDADIEVPPTWVTHLLPHATPGTGVVTGITTTKGNSLFARLQRLDWLYNLGLMQVVADRDVPVSTMGNNMLVTRQAYEAVGGYEGIPFSITEDVQLFKQISGRGFKTKNLYAPEVLALSVPAQDLPELLHQRRRWMRGSLHLPWYMLLLFVVHTAYYPVWAPFFLHASGGVMAGIFLLKLILQSLFVHRCLHYAGLKTPWHLVLLLEVYLLLTSLALLVLFFLPFKIRWKGRLY